MNKVKYRKSSSDLRRVLMHDIPQSGKFFKIVEEDTIYLYHIALGNVIAIIDFTDQDGKRVAVLRYRPASIYRQIIRDLCFKMGADRVLAVPSKLLNARYVTSGYTIQKENEALRKNLNAHFAKQLSKEKIRDPFCFPPVVADNLQARQTPRVVTYQAY